MKLLVLLTLLLTLDACQNPGRFQGPQPMPRPPDHLSRFQFNSKWLALRALCAMPSPSTPSASDATARPDQSESGFPRKSEGASLTH